MHWSAETDDDGKGGLDGQVWKVRFAADRNGKWSYRTESPHPQLNGRTGSFQVTDPPANAPEFHRKGRIEYVGARCLKFREGGYWLKFGADEPENLLGTAFGLNDWEAKKQEIDYLAARRINSVYVMTHTLEGDANDVWPWVGATPEEAKRNHQRFDAAKLEKWRELFEHAQAKGIVIQLVLEDDSGWTGHDHARHYREIIARFGYLAGGMWESLVRAPGGFADGERVWNELAATRTFMESLPFHEMHPANHVVVEGLAALAAPDGRDWAARLSRTGGSAEAPPTAVSAKLFATRAQPVPLRLAALPAGADLAYVYEIVDLPRHGKLSGNGADRVYAPRPGFSGKDRFSWRVRLGAQVSNIATVEITCNATGVNAPAKAHDQTVVVQADKWQSFILRYTDPDGPRPYQVRVVTPPSHGSIEGLDNDLIYTPAPDFRGEDGLVWTVSDGQARPNRAKVTLRVK